MMKKSNFALEAYRKVEAPENFESRAAVLRYRKQLLDRALAREIPFFQTLIGRPSRILEIASGCSRLLYALDQVGLLESGIGVEISPSRHAFAAAWKKDLQADHVTNICIDALHWKAPKRCFDVVFCMTSIFPFFDVLAKNGGRRMLELMTEALVPGGLLVIESETFIREAMLCEQMGGTVRLWNEYLQDDPFRFELSSYSLDPGTRRLTVQTTHIKRNEHFFDGPVTKIFQLRPASKYRDLLRSAGLEKIRLFGGFNQRTRLTRNSTRVIAVGRRP